MRAGRAGRGRLGEMTDLTLDHGEPECLVVPVVRHLISDPGGPGGTGRNLLLLVRGTQRILSWDGGGGGSAGGADDALRDH